MYVTIGDRINNYLRKNYNIEWINREVRINSKIRVTELSAIRTFLKNNGINYKNIIVKGDSRVSNYIPI